LLGQPREVLTDANARNASGDGLELTADLRRRRLTEASLRC
jgi:hypothetical protein